MLPQQEVLSLSNSLSVGGMWPDVNLQLAVTKASPAESEIDAV